MNDEALRQLSRSNDARDRARVLIEAVRRGALTYERLVWGASLGHEEAVLAVGRPEPPPLDWANFEERRRALSAVSACVAARDPWRRKRMIVAVGADVAERALPVFESGNPGDARPRGAITAVRAWIKAGYRRQRRARNLALVAGNAAADAEVEQARRRRVEILTRTAPLIPFRERAPEAFAAGAAATVANYLGYGLHAALGAALAAERAALAREDMDAEFSWQRLRLANYALGRFVVGSVA